MVITEYNRRSDSIHSAILIVDGIAQRRTSGLYQEILEQVFTSLSGVPLIIIIAKIEQFVSLTGPESLQLLSIHGEYATCH